MMTDACHAAVSGVSPTEPPRNVPSKRCVIVPQVELCACRGTTMLIEEDRTWQSDRRWIPRSMKSQWTTGQRSVDDAQKKLTPHLPRMTLPPCRPTADAGLPLGDYLLRFTTPPVVRSPTAASCHQFPDLST